MFRATFKRCALTAMTAALALPQVPHHAAAAEPSVRINLPTIGNTNDTGLISPTAPLPTPTSSPKPNSSASTPAPAKGSISVAKVPDQFSCPLFENRPHSELIEAIDSLTRAVNASPECTGNPSVKSLEQNGNTIKDSIQVIQSAMALQDPNAVNVAEIDQTMTAAINAVNNLGDIFNNNTFLNSRCGRETMSAGKVLLALNDVVAGLAPYALFAVSMNAALTPALPFVIGGVVATSGVSAIAKMMAQGNLDMSKPDHRKAVLQNTCQFTKVAEKVRFMQLAQSGKISRITQELEKTVDLYNANFAKPSKELTALLNYKAKMDKNILISEEQLAHDKADLEAVEYQISQNRDDLMVCTLGNELVAWAQDGKSFPASVFINLDNATQQAPRSQRLSAVTMNTIHQTSMKRIAAFASSISENDGALTSCAQASRSWIASVKQSIAITEGIINQNRVSLESELSANNEYRQWLAQYKKIENEKQTIKRVEKAMKELSKDNSIIDRSELDQRMSLLKAGLFGKNSGWNVSTPLVLQWMNHTKTMHDRSVSSFLAGMKAAKQGAWSLTETGQGKALKHTLSGVPYNDPAMEARDTKLMNSLSTLNLSMLPMGSRRHEVACQTLETAWLDWSAAIDHLGAIQFFCDMIDPVLDVKIDSSVVYACRGNVQLNGTKLRDSMVNRAKLTLSQKGFQADANLISQKLKSLRCPAPSITVMNQ